MALRRSAEIAVSSKLDAGAEQVWARIITPEGINAELMPWMRMTAPSGLTSLDPESIELGKPIGRSWVLLLGLLPVDFDEINLVKLEPGRGFVEQSRMLSQRSWKHARTLEPLGRGGCVITDRVSWEPRLPVPGGLLKPLFSAIFGHRHRRLRRQFGGRPAATSSH